MEERPSQVIEEYLLALYKLQRDGEKAKSVTLANSLDTSAPTVHATVDRMQRDGSACLALGLGDARARRLVYHFTDGVGMPCRLRAPDRLS